MNKNQVEGVVKDIAGKVQEEAGKLVGSKEQQVKGLSKQISGGFKFEVQQPVFAWCSLATPRRIPRVAF